MNISKRLKEQLGLASLIAVFCCTCSCDPQRPAPSGTSDQFETVPEKFPITPGIIDEASGLVPSYSISGHLWTMQDSGQPNSVYLLSTDGKTIREYNIPGSRNRDWEDMAIGPGPQEGVNYLYIGDTGNNAKDAEQMVIYRVPEINEPSAAFQAEKVERITFKYPDGRKDAESLLLDPATKDLFVISKEDNTAGIYRLAYPQSTSATVIAEKVGIIPNVSIATGANVSRDGKQIMVRTYLAAYYWRKTDAETIGQTLARPANRQLLIAPEPQGEAICFDIDGSGFYTLSERSTSVSVNLHYYKRK